VRIPKYRKHSSRDFAFVEWKGKRYPLPGLYNSAESVDAYKQFLLLNVGVADTRPAPVSTSLSVAGLVTAYLEHAEKYYGGGSRGEYANMRHALKPLGMEYWQLPAAQFGPLKLQEWVDKLIEKGHARPYINQQAAKVKRMFKWAASKELLPVAVYQALATVQGLAAGRTEAAEPELRQPVAWDVVAATLVELSPLVADMVRIQWYTSVRSNSLCRATPAQFDRSVDPWLWRPRHKTEFRGHELIIPVGPKCQAILLPYLDRPADAYLFDPRTQRANRRYRKHYGTASYYRAIQRAIERVNVKREKSGQKPIPAWFPHQIRHARGQQIREQFGIEGAQAHLGHDSMEATEIYSARRLELAKEIARKLG
jgi:integrase